MLHCQDQERALLLVAWIFSKAACTLDCAFNYIETIVRMGQILKYINALISAHNGIPKHQKTALENALIKALHTAVSLIENEVLRTFL